MAKSTTNTNVFEDYQITLTIPAQHYTPAHRKAIKKSVAKQGAVSLQQTCAVAEATNEALGGVYKGDRIIEREVLEFDGVGRFVLNPKSPARFGLDQKQNVFLTVGLIEEGHEEEAPRYRLTWKGDHVPETLARIAVAHDAGESHGDVQIDLDMGAATLSKQPPGKTDQRPNTAKRREQKNGKPDHRGQPRKHRRLCAEDINRIYAK